MLVCICQSQSPNLSLPHLSPGNHKFAFYICDYFYHKLFIHSSVDGHLGCFHLLAIVNNAAMNICVQEFVWTSTVNSFGYTPWSEIAGSGGNSVTFWGTPILFSTASALLHFGGIVWLTLSLYNGKWVEGSSSHLGRSTSPQSQPTQWTPKLYRREEP